MRDVDGRVQKVRVDVSYVDGLLDYLDTTPAQRSPRPAGDHCRPSGGPGGRDMARARATGSRRSCSHSAYSPVPRIAWPVVGAPRRRRRTGPSRPRPPQTSAPPRSGRPTSAPASRKLQEVSEPRAQCRKAPTPSTPDSGLAGWFAARPDVSEAAGPHGLYSDYGYAGYSYTTYDIEVAAPRP